MTNEEFDTQLQHHDWYYYFTDDPRVFRKGYDASKALSNQMKSATDDMKRIYNKYHALHFRTENFHKNREEYKYPYPELVPLLPE